MRTTRILLNQIDFLDTTYKLTPDNNDQVDHELKESIKRVGILHPPIVKAQKEGSYRIVSGFKRLNALQEMTGQMSCECRIIPEESKDIDVLAIALEELIVTNQVTVVRQAIFLKKSCSWTNEQETADRFLPIMGLAAGKFVIQKLTKLLDLEEPVLLALDQGKLDEQVARDMLAMPFVDRMALFEIIDFLNLSRGNQKKINISCKELASRNNTNILSILSDAEIRSALTSTTMNKPQQATHIMSRLTELRFPRLNRAEREFHQFKNSLNLPQHISIAHVPSFETDGVSFTITYKNREDLEKSWEKIKGFC